MAATKAKGQTASQSIRGYISDVLNPERGKAHKRALWATAVALILITGTLVVTLAVRTGGAPSTSQRVIAAYDKNGDSVLTSLDIDENDKGAATLISYLLATADFNGDGAVDVQEFQRVRRAEIDVSSMVGGGPSNGSERVLVIPPGLSRAEQRAYLKRQIDTGALSDRDREQVLRLIEALAVDPDAAADDQP